MTYFERMAFWRKAGLTGIALLLFGLIVFTGWQHQRLSRAQAENEQLQLQLTEVREAQAVSEAPGPAPSAPEESELARQELLELLRLRNEVGQLRDRQQELEKARLENAQLRVWVRALEAGYEGATMSFAPRITPRPNAWIGANIMPRPDNSDPAVQRVVVGGIVNNSPAAEAGLEEGDVVINADGQAITNVWQLIAAVTNGLPGQQLLLDVIRNGTPAQVLVTRQAPPGLQQSAASK